MAVFHSSDAVRDAAIARITNPRLEGFGVPAADPALITQLATQAESRLETTLGVVYALPLQNPQTGLLQQAVEQLAVCQLIRTLYTGPQPSSEGDQFNEKTCEIAEKILKDIATGKVRLVGERPPNEQVPGRFLAVATVDREETAIEEIEWADDDPRIGLGFGSGSVAGGGRFGF